MESSSGRAPHRHFSQLWMFTVFTITVTLFSGSFVTSAFGAPAKLDAIAPQPQTPFPLEAQPTLFTDAFSAALNRYNGKNSGDGGNNGGEGNSDFHKTRTTAIDSYGNPIETLKPIDTPDGRKVISAQGLQFEIPNYASGITEIKQPADDLLPPFIGELNINNTNTKKNTNFSAAHNKHNLRVNTTYTNTNEQQNKNEYGGNKQLALEDDDVDGQFSISRNMYNVGNSVTDQSALESASNIHQNNSKATESIMDNEGKLRVNADADVTANGWHKHSAIENSIEESNVAQFDKMLLTPDNTVSYSGGDLNATAILHTNLETQNKYLIGVERALADTNASNVSTTTTTNTLINIQNASTISTTTKKPFNLIISHMPLDAPKLFNLTHTVKNTLINLNDEYFNSFAPQLITLPMPSDALIEHNTDPTKPNISQTQFITNKTKKNKNFIRQVVEANNTSSITQTKLPPPPLPLSNGNFNYPNVPTDQAIIERIAAKYQNPLPTLDPIAVAVPSDSADGTSTSGAGSSVDTAATTTVAVESAELIELKPDAALPSYIVELNDPDIGGPVEYMPVDDGTALKVIAWDLLPPVEQDAPINPADTQLNPNAKVSLTAASSTATTTVTPLTHTNRGNIHYTSPTTTTARPTAARTTRPTTQTKTTARSTTTTTRRPATTTTRRPTTTTTRRPTTTTARTTTTTTTTAAPLNPDDFYQLEHGDSYTLPSWLADVDDPELDAAVTYIVPENIHEYNDTIARDILPPYEPYIDLNNIDLPAPAGTQTIATTTKLPRTTVASTSKRPSSTSSTSHASATTPQPSWLRTTPTSYVSTSTSTRSPFSFVDRFSSNNIAQTHNVPKIASPSTLQNFKTSTTTQTPRLTSTAPHISSSGFNQNLPITTTTDRITSAEVETSQAVGKFKFSHTNPFLSSSSLGKLPTATTTTTTTTPATSVEENPFNSATLPSWLTDFDYPDLAPGVPFIYNAENSESDVYNDLLPPSQLNAEATDATKPTFITSSPTSLTSFQAPTSLNNRHDPILASASTSTPRTFAFNNNFPSKITTTAKPSNIHNTFARDPTNNNYNNVKHQEASVTLPSVVFDPPSITANDVSNINPQTDNVDSNTFNHQEQQPQLQSAGSANQFLNKIPSSSSFNNNFAAPFDTTTASGSSNVAISTDPTKTTFTKSNEGKVITNNVFGAFSSVATPSKQFSFGTSTTTGQSTVQKGFQQSTSNTFASSTNSFAGSSSTFNKASTPSGFSTFASTQTSTNFGGLNKGAAGHATNIGAGKYTGSFGGSPGVLGNGKVGYALQTDGSIRSPSKGQAAVPAAHTTASKQPASPSIASRVGGAAPVGLNKFQGSFGGPPGVLVPFDNVKSG